MSDATKAAAAELRREVESKSRDLEMKQHQLLSLMRGTKSETGERTVQAHQAEQIRSLERDCVALTDQVNALKLDYIQARTEEDLERRQTDALAPAGIWAGTGGSSADAADAVAAKGGRIPDSLGDAFVNSAAYKSWNHGAQNQVAHCEVPVLNMRDFAIKATLTTATGPFTSIEKQPTAVTLGQQQLTVADLFSTATTTSTTIRYIREDSFTNAAAWIAEEGQKPEMTWDFSEVDVTVKKVAVYTRMTSEMYEDYGQVRAVVDDRIPFAVRQREEFSLLNGAGGNDLSGLLGTSGVLTQAKGTYSNVDAIYLGITKVRTQGFYEPDAVVIDPANWNAIRLLKTTTGEYVYGDPWTPGPETIFGKRVIITVNMGLAAANTAVVGAWRMGGTIFYRQGIRVEATNSDASDFQYNRIAMRAEQREALAVWRPPAFCKVTGLDVAP